MIPVSPIKEYNIDTSLEDQILRRIAETRKREEFEKSKGVETKANEEWGELRFQTKLLSELSNKKEKKEEEDEKKDFWLPGKKKEEEEENINNNPSFAYSSAFTNSNTFESKINNSNSPYPHGNISPLIKDPNFRQIGNNNSNNNNYNTQSFPQFNSEEETSCYTRLISRVSISSKTTTNDLCEFLTRVCVGDFDKCEDFEKFFFQIRAFGFSVKEVKASMLLHGNDMNKCIDFITQNRNM